MIEKIGIAECICDRVGVMYHGKLREVNKETVQIYFPHSSF